MTFDTIDSWWWPYVFILLAGWLATDSWRFIGVYLGGRISEQSEILVLVRCIATALVAAVVANLVLYPTGALSNFPVALRFFAMVAGFSAYLLAGKRTLAGIVAAEAVFLFGMTVWPPG